MPSAYTRVLKLPAQTPWKGDNVYSAVMDLVLSFHLNYEMLFPAVGEAHMLMQLARTLALPSTSVVSLAMEVFMLICEQLNLWSSPENCLRFSDVLFSTRC